jgi:hypothetical protein
VAWPVLSVSVIDKTEAFMNRIVVQGPLAPFADGLRQNLTGRGYALDTTVDHILYRSKSHRCTSRAVAALVGGLSERACRAVFG